MLRRNIIFVTYMYRDFIVMEDPNCFHRLTTTINTWINSTLVHNIPFESNCLGAIERYFNSAISVLYLVVTCK